MAPAPLLRFARRSIAGRPLAWPVRSGSALPAAEPRESGVRAPWQCIIATWLLDGKGPGWVRQDAPIEQRPTKTLRDEDAQESVGGEKTEPRMDTNGHESIDRAIRLNGDSPEKRPISHSTGKARSIQTIPISLIAIFAEPSTLSPDNFHASAPTSDELAYGEMPRLVFFTKRASSTHNGSSARSLSIRSIAVPFDRLCL